MTEAGRELSELEMVGGIRGEFHGADDLADLDQAMATLPEQLAQGFTTICFKPAMFVRTAAEVPGLCRELADRLSALAD
jgi:hypothetical protein